MKIQSNYKDIKNDILKQILNEEIKPDFPLPTRKFFKEKYKVAIATVDRAIQELQMEGYLYGIQGKGTFLAQKKKINTIGIVFCSLAQNESHLAAYYLKVLEAVQNRAYSAKIRTCICTPGEGLDRVSLVRCMNELEVDSYIIFALADIEMFHSFKSMCKPMIIVNPRINIPDGFNVVREDSRQMMYELGMYIREKSYRRIAYIWPEQEKQIFLDRKEWLERFCMENNIIFDNAFSYHSNLETRAVQDFIDRYISSKLKPDAVITSRPSLAIILDSELKKIGTVKKTEILTVSDKRISPEEVVKLTRIEMDEAYFGEKVFSAFEILANNSSSVPFEVLVPGKLIEVN